MIFEANNRYSFTLSPIEISEVDKIVFNLLSDDRIFATHSILMRNARSSAQLIFTSRRLVIVDKGSNDNTKEIGCIPYSKVVAYNVYGERDSNVLHNKLGLLFESNILLDLTFNSQVDLYTLCRLISDRIV